MTIGERIRLRRTELDMTQQELAEKVGYKSKTAINKIETGERELRQTKIRPMAEALSTTIEYIMGWDESESELFTKDNIEILRDLCSLTKDEQETIRAIINQYKRNKSDTK